MGKNEKKVLFMSFCQYKVLTLVIFIGYIHKNQHCMRGGEGEATAKMKIVGKTVKCSKTSDHGCSCMYA